MFAISAVNGEGCRELTFAIQDWLDAHPAPVECDEAADDATAVVVTPAPVRTRRRRTEEPRACAMSVVRTRKRLVVKVGSTLVTNEGRGLDHAAVARWAEQIAAL